MLAYTVVKMYKYSNWEIPALLTAPADDAETVERSTAYTRNYHGTFNSIRPVGLAKRFYR